MSGTPATLPSLLFLDPAQAAEAEARATPTPACFGDLDLDQIVDAVVSGRDEYRLRPLFHRPLEDVDSVSYRQEVFADLDGAKLLHSIVTFATRMRSIREMLSRTASAHHRYQRRTRLLTAASAYVEAVTGLLKGLERSVVTSRALGQLRDSLGQYVGSAAFQTLSRDTKVVEDAIAGIRYTLLFYANVIRVRRFDGEADYGAEIASFFARFRQRDGGDRDGVPPDPEVRNRIEEQVLDRVVALFPEAFGALDRFCDAHPSWLDDAVSRLDQEVQFYLAGLELVGRLRNAGLPVCYPAVSTDSKAETVHATYDLALALRLLSAPDSPGGPGAVVTNDYQLSGPERVIVVTGPNQGGKTTFARAFGQLHWLASLGWPVPGAEARLFLSDAVFSHFERAEHGDDMRGKLEDDLLRLHEILGRATERSVTILNEVFSSTTLRDATVLSRAVLTSLSKVDGLAVCVTFIDELATFDRKTVSMVAGVDPADPAVRTFKLERRPADGRAYAVGLAERYRLSRDQVKERLGR